MVQNLKKIGCDNADQVNLTKIRCHVYDNYVVLFDNKVFVTGMEA